MFCGKAIFFNLSYSFDRLSLPYYELRRILSNSYLNGWIARSDCPNLMRILGIFFERALLTTLETRRPQNSCRWSWYPTWPGTSFWRKAGDRSLCPNLDWGFKVLSNVYWCKISIIYSRKKSFCVFSYLTVMSIGAPSVVEAGEAVAPLGTCSPLHWWSIGSLALVPGGWDCRRREWEKPVPPDLASSVMKYIRVRLSHF